jgi:hypothetical protein
MGNRGRESTSTTHKEWIETTEMETQIDESVIGKEKKKCVRKPKNHQQSIKLV